MKTESEKSNRNKQNMKLDEVKADRESIKDRVRISVRVSPSVMQKNTKSLKMKFLGSCPQTPYNFITQR